MNMAQRIESLESDDISSFGLKLTGLEGKFGGVYFEQIFKLFSEELRPSGRHTFLAYDGLNNIFNLAYEMLSWKVHKARA
jgi:CRISPR/Cas system-associated endonuclease Cas1